MPTSRNVARLCAFLAAASVAGGVSSSGAEAAHPASHGCSRLASPRGSDGWSGTKLRPFRTAQRLIDSLRPGQVGCLRGGTYFAADDFVVRFDRGGTSRRRITLRSYPGERAKLVGNVEVTKGSNYVTLTRLHIVGTGGSNTVKIYARDTILQDSDITNVWRGRSCVMLGSDMYGVANRPIVRRNRFHECGSLANGNQDHAIYAQSVSDGQITRNVFWNTAAYAIQLYPNARRTRVAYNVIDGGRPSVRGGILFGGEGNEASSRNVVERNVIAYATSYNLAADWHELTGTGNVATKNCLWEGRDGNVDQSEGGFAAYANVVADPMFRDRGARDYRLSGTSRCRRVIGRDPAAHLSPP